jgi:twinkle protein
MKTANQVSALLAKRIDDVAAYLLPQGKKSGNEWKVGSLFGEPGQSLCIHLSGAKAGIWCDFSTGESGDALSLWAAVKRITVRDAIKEAVRYLNIAVPVLSAMSDKKYKRPAPREFKFADEVSLAKKYLIEERKLQEVILRQFRIGESENDILFPFYRDGELLLIKKLNINRHEGKKVISLTDKECEMCLFGWQAIDLAARTLVICEGEIDAMSLVQYGYNAVSIPMGVNNDQWIENDFDMLAIYDEIYLCMDNDAPGQKAAHIFAQRLGNFRCRNVILPKKDANECLQAGIEPSVIAECFEKATYFDPIEIKPMHLFEKEVMERFYPTSQKKGYRSLLQKSQGKIIFQPAELSLWCGINGHGKSQFIGQLALDMMMQGAKICIASMEIRPEILLERLTRQAAGMRLPTREYIIAIQKWYEGKGWLGTITGTAKRQRLLESFLYVHQRYGVDVFFIDSLMKCGIAEDDFNEQKLFVEQLCDFKNTCNVHIHLVVHPRKNDNESEMPGKMDVKGTGAISDLADNVFTIWRNKYKEDQIRKAHSASIKHSEELLNKYDAIWSCDKQRNGEWEGKIFLWFDKESFQFLNSSDQIARQYVQFSKPVER